MLTEPKSSLQLRPSALVSRIVLATLPLLLLGCLQSGFTTGEKLYEQGRYSEAIAAFDGYLEASPARPERQAKALYSIALMHADQSGEVYDPERSVSLFRQLCELHPDSRECSLATLITDLQSEILRLSQLFAEEEAYSRSMDASLSRARSQVEQLGGELNEQTEAASSLQEEVATLASQLRRIRTLLSEREARVAELERALDELKRIAVETPP